ncbi:acetyltransferase [Salinimicrobium marinum]|uniref:Acetyltransferase n=1 Tax=Salinimicrobium marinum TaxID=680283 RepID=A0A918VW74_9FLAO|nr:acetyltransferase [Salinimicrobium marinum]GHA30385.1 acetyltransferase [Salinimicrobium marinum]
MNLYGASGHTKVIIDIVKSKNGQIDYVFDDNPEIKSILGYEVVNYPTEEMLKSKLNVIGIGNNRIRKKVADSLKGGVHPYISHLSAVISASAEIGDGTVIMANATINSEAQVGKHCIINTGAVVEHEVILEDYVHISPNASIAGDVQIGEGSHIGIGSSVIQGLTIGKWVTVGAGAVIIEDIPDYVTVVGNPGRIIKT